MEGISNITDFNSLKQAFLKLDTSLDGHISSQESADDIQEYDQDNNSSVEIWEYMAAANQETKNGIFRNYEIEADKKAYQIFSKYLISLPETRRDDITNTFGCTGTCVNQVVPLIEFAQAALQLGVEESRILGLMPYDDRTPSLLRIGANDNEIMTILSYLGTFPEAREGLDNYIETLWGSGFDKNEIIARLKNIFEEAAKIGPLRREHFYSNGLAVKFYPHRPGKELVDALKSSGFDNDEVLSLRRKIFSFIDNNTGDDYFSKDEQEKLLTAIRELLVAGVSKNDILEYANATEQMPNILPGIYSSLIANDPNKDRALKLVTDLTRKGNLKLLSDYPEIVLYLLNSYKLETKIIWDFLSGLPEDSYYLGKFISKMLSKYNNEDALKYISYLFKAIPFISQDLNNNEKIELSDILYQAKEITPGGEYFGEYKKAAELVAGSPNGHLKEVYYLGLLSFILFEAQDYQNFDPKYYQDSITYAQKIIRDYIAPLATNDTRLMLLKNLAASESFQPRFRTGAGLARIIEMDGISLVARKNDDHQPIIIPGSIRLEADKAIIEYFNRRNFIAVFENPQKTIGFAPELIRASEALPDEFFNSFDPSQKLQVIFREAGVSEFAGSYPPNKVLINTSSGCSLSTIAHEFGHHWDLNLSVGFSSGKQETTGDPSLLYYKISWTPERIKREVWGGEFDINKNDRSDFDKKDFARDYGLSNRKEDFATVFENYVSFGQALRSRIRELMRTGNFELAAKYLFVKYIAPFRGREYGLSESDKAITFEEVEKTIEGIPDKSSTDPRTFDIIKEIKQKSGAASGG
jgi:DNA-binding transcriptional regulator YhcF (GntR family)